MKKQVLVILNETAMKFFVGFWTDGPAWSEEFPDAEHLEGIRAARQAMKKLGTAERLSIWDHETYGNEDARSLDQNYPLCCDCRDGEHMNKTDDVRLVVVRDPDTGHLRRRGYLCSEHRQMYREDGYLVRSET